MTNNSLSVKRKAEFSSRRIAISFAFTPRAHSSGHCGMDMRTIGEMIQGLVLIWEIMEPDEMVNRVEYL